MCKILLTDFLKKPWYFPMPTWGRCGKSWCYSGSKARSSRWTRSHESVSLRGRDIVDRLRRAVDIESLRGAGKRGPANTAVGCARARIPVRAFAGSSFGILLGPDERRLRRPDVWPGCLLVDIRRLFGGPV